MKISVLAFGPAADLIGKRYDSLHMEKGMSIVELRNVLMRAYPGLASLPKFMLAVNEVYARDTDMVHENDEVAIIPPVSGG